MSKCITKLQSSLSHATTQEPLSARLIIMDQSSARLRLARHCSLVHLKALGLLGKKKNSSLSNLLRNNLTYGCPGGGFQLDLGRKTSLKLGNGSSLKYHLHLIFLLNSPKSLLRSSLLIILGAGTKPYPFSKTLISI